MSFKKYLLRKRALGDVLWIEPVIRQLAGQNRKLVVNTKYNQLFENYPLANVHFKKELNPFEKLLIRIEDVLHTQFFSVSLENTYEKEPKTHLLHAFQKKAGLPLTDEYPQIYLSQAERNSPPFTKPYAVLHLESLTEKNYRNVFGLDWDLLVKFLTEQGIMVVQVGVNPKPISNTFVHKTSIRQLITTIYHSQIFIGLDSGPSHIAASLGIPSIIFFGGVNPLYRHFPHLLNGIIMQGKCEYNGCYHEVVQDLAGPSCRLVGDEGIPKCSVHSTFDLIANVQKLL